MREECAQLLSFDDHNSLHQHLWDFKHGSGAWMREGVFCFLIIYYVHPINIYGISNTDLGHSPCETQPDANRQRRAEHQQQAGLEYGSHFELIFHLPATNRLDHVMPGIWVTLSPITKHCILEQLVVFRRAVSLWNSGNTKVGPSSLCRPYKILHHQQKVVVSS